MENRRKYSRVSMMLHGVLISDFVDTRTEIKIIDVSLNGALIKLVHDFDVFIAHKYDIEFRLGGSNKIRMQCICRHKRGKMVGLQCLHIDLESISSLRRLIELNIGESRMLHRELDELMHFDVES
ncbi:PilZ domain [Anaerobiospirillum thomasii]|uniref:Cyclic diguanosine monophosphate-binding protein n=1 Tax=Anaerobiospirillum thomasii TaxID=179995 RepID=A0A2X0VH04_9GAMM|nr:PilZ domain-containing protein [Anaerobiospirillum thomasii]SPT68572.1 PilZ domain [Anaerobiospirillum thomasii]SPT68758.1 PilZ domain [Anaerobiospirillum thomasii]